MAKLNEYARNVGQDLQRAHNAKDSARVNQVFASVDQNLTKNEISDAEKKKFWEEVAAIYRSGQLLMEKQANSALMALIQSIERNLAARGGNK